MLTKTPEKTKKSRKTEIIKDASLYAGSTYAATFLDVVNGIILRNLIAPANMGVWSFLQVILGYSKYATLGTGPAMVREIPFQRGRGENARAEQIKNNVFSWSLFTSSLLGVGIVTYVLIAKGTLSKEMLWGLIAIAGITILQRCYNLYVVLLRAYKSFRLASLSSILSSFITLVLTLTLVWKFGFYGLLLSAVAGYLLTLSIIHRNSGFHFKIEFDKKIIKEVSILGISLVAVQACMTVLRSVDRLCIAKWLNFEALGFYSVAIMFQTYLTILPNVVDMVINPHLFEKAGEDSDPERIKRNVLEPLLVMSCVMPCCILLSWVFVPPMVRFLMPEYTAGIYSAKILLFTSFFIGAARPLMAYLILLKRHLRLIPILLFASAASAALNWYLLTVQHQGLEAVAVSSVLGFGIFFISLLLISARSLTSFRGTPVVMLKVTAPLFYTIFVVKLLDALFPIVDRTLLGWLTAFAMSGIFCVPLMFFMERETGVVTRSKLILLEKFNGRSLREGDSNGSF